jgi:hypothetical protein
MNQLTMGKTGKQFIIKDVLAYWAKVHTPGLKYKTTTNEKEFSMTLVISEDTVDALSDNNLNKAPTSIATQNKKDLKKKGEASYPAELEDDFLLKLASPALWPDGKSKVIKVVMNKEVFTENIGNGSLVDVICHVGKANDEGLSAVYLESINVKELIEYEDEFEFEEAEASGSIDDDDLSF